MWVAEKIFILEEERNEPEQRVASAMVRLLVTAGSLNSHFDGKYNDLLPYDIANNYWGAHF